MTEQYNTAQHILYWALSDSECYARLAKLKAMPQHPSLCTEYNLLAHRAYTKAVRAGDMEPAGVTDILEGALAIARHEQEEY